MGSVRSKLMKTMQNSILTTRRLEKVLDKEKPEVAPRHKTTVDKIDALLKAHPEIEDEQATKNNTYLNMLSTLHVDSQDPQVKSVDNLQSMRPKLVLNRIPADKLIELFDRRSKDSEAWNVEKISETYRLERETAKLLCQYYSSFQKCKTEQKKGPLDQVSF